MPRPKPLSPPIQVLLKLPPELHAAFIAIVPHWCAEMTAQLAAKGIHTPLRADRTAWLQAKIREDAARYGVAIPSSLPPGPPRPVPKPRQRRQRVAEPPVDITHPSAQIEAP